MSETVLCACSQLYGEFADPLGLAECQLAIVHCAGHHDPTLIETLWRNIIDKGAYMYQEVYVASHQEESST